MWEEKIRQLGCQTQLHELSFSLLCCLRPWYWLVLLFLHLQTHKVDRERERARKIFMSEWCDARSMFCAIKEGFISWWDWIYCNIVGIIVSCKIIFPKNSSNELKVVLSLNKFILELPQYLFVAWKSIHSSEFILWKMLANLSSRGKCM